MNRKRRSICGEVVKLLFVVEVVEKMQGWRNRRRINKRRQKRSGKEEQKEKRDIL